MKIFVDADACPVINETIEVANMFDLEVILICDSSHYINREDAKTITVSKGSDSADFYIVNNMEANDIVITQDYGLATMVIAKKGHAVNQNGYLYTDQNIDRLLETRHISQKIRKAGGRTKGPKKRKSEDNDRFKEVLIHLFKKIV